MRRKINSKRKLAPRKEPLECLCCGSASPWVIVPLSQETSYRDQTHTVQVEVTQCRHCDAVITSPSQNAALLKKSEEAHRGWIAQTLKAARKKLKLPQREFAVALGVGTATLSRALKGESTIDQSTEALALIRIKELEKAQEIKELLALELKKSSYTGDEPDDPWFPPTGAADSNELALAA